MVKSFESIDDYSCKFVTISEHIVFPQPDEVYKKLRGQSLPKENSQLVWIKNPNMMKTRNNFAGTIVKTSIKRLDDGVFATYWYPKTNTVQKSKLPDNAWPSWPSPGSITKIIKDFIAQNKTYTIEETKDNEIDIYMITFSEKNGEREDVYYVRKADWMIYKSVVHLNGKISQTSEWRNIRINSGIDDSSFNLQIPNDAKVLTKDISVPKK